MLSNIQWRIQSYRLGTMRPQLRSSLIKVGLDNELNFRKLSCAGVYEKLLIAEEANHLRSSVTHRLEARQT